MHILCMSGPGIYARDLEGVRRLQPEEGQVLLPRSKNIGRDYHHIRGGENDAEAKKGQDIGAATESPATHSRGQKANRQDGRIA
jgi:hypothetical protein